MTNETKAADWQNKMSDLKRYVERHIRKNEGIVKSAMEDLADDFNGNFEYVTEKIYKSNLKLEFLKDIRALLNDEESNIDAVRFQLRHAAEHASDDIMHRDPYSNSSNAAANLTHRWTYETYKEIYHLALSLLDNIAPEEPIKG